MCIIQITSLNSNKKSMGLLLLLFHFMKEKTEARTDRLGDMPRSQKGSAKVDIWVQAMQC